MCVYTYNIKPLYFMNNSQNPKHQIPQATLSFKKQ